jgi:uncharacterized protein YfaS (alpha-2-macroglobulin family)
MMKSWFIILTLPALLTILSCTKEEPQEKPFQKPSEPPLEVKEPPSEFFPSSLSLDELKVISYFPKGKVESVEETREIIVTFNNPMIPLQEVPREELPFPLKITPVTKGKWEWRGTRTIVFIPQPGFPIATKFIVLVPKGVKSISGAELKQDFEWSFETVRPDLVRSHPHHNSKWYPLDQKVFLEFNIPMSPEKAKLFISVRDEGGTSIPFKIRHIDPSEKKIHWRFQSGDPKRVLALEPLKKYERERWYTVTLSPGLPAEEGNLGSAKAREFRFFPQHVFRFAGILSSNSHPPEERLRFNFSNPVISADLVRNISITPAIEIPKHYERSNHSDSLFSLGVELLPDTQYIIQISGKLQDRFGNPLGQDHGVQVSTISYHPNLWMPTGTGIVESYTQLRHPVTLLNTDSLRLQMAYLNERDVIPLLETQGLFSTWSPYSPNRFYGVDRIWKPSLVRNRKTLLPIELKEVLSKKDQNGFVFIQLDALRGMGYRSTQNRYFKTFLDVTDLGITAKFSSENGLVWVTRLKDSTPEEGSVVRLRSKENRVLWEGTTDEDGLVMIPGWKELNLASDRRREIPKFYIYAQKKDEEALISSRWGTGIYPYRFGIPYNWNPEPKRFEGFLYTEKGLYRSGQEVHIKGMVREKTWGKWVYSKQKDFTLLIKNARDEEIVKEEVTLSDLGSFDYSLKLEEDAPTGVYKIRFQGEVEKKKLRFFKSFRVEAYEPAQFEVKVRSKKEAYTFEEEYTASITGWYLFGSPMSGEDVRWDLNLFPFRYIPPMWEGFRFGPRWPEDSDSRKRIASGKGKLDSKGKVEAKTSLDGKGIKGTMRLVCEGTVTAKNKRSISGRKDFIIHRGDYYIGLKPSDTFLETGDLLKIEAIAVDPSGQIVPDEELKFTILRREWQSVRKAETGGRYHWISTSKDTTLVSKILRTGLKPVVEKITPEKPGRYFVRCEGEDSKGNQILSNFAFWVGGKGYVSWMRRDDDIIELEKDKILYRPGENARILVKSPYEKAKVLVTIEREFVLDKFVTEIQGSAEILKIPIKEEYLPNVFISVILIQGRTGEKIFSEKGVDIGKPSFKIGYTLLSVSPVSKKLEVTVKTDKPEYRPKGEVTVEITVKDHNGKGVESEVSLAGVDLGVLNLIGYMTPNPFTHFYQERPLSVRTSELRLHIIGERDYGEKGEERGGGGMMAEGFQYREKFIETVYWNPVIKTDGEGRATITFELPDNLTTFRMMAVASTEESFGSGDTAFVVNKPFLMKPSLPRFVRMKDEFWGGVMAHNLTPEDGDVRIDASGEGLELLEVGKKEMRVEAQEEEEFLFHWSVKDTGEVTLYFKGVMGDEGDGLKITLPSLLPKTSEAVAVYEQTLEDAMEWVVIPDSIYPDVGGLEFSLSSSALAGLERGVDYLQTFNYDCLEQRLSKILPFILAEEIINTFNLSDLKGEELRRFVSGELSRVKDYQDGSGGFHFWTPPWYGPPSPYLSAYTMYTLAMAKRAGYPLDERVITKGNGYLKNILRSKDWKWQWPYSLNEKLTTATFIVYSLSLWDVREEAYIHRLFENREQISLFGKALLIKSIREAKLEEEMIDSLVEILFNKIKVEPTMAHFEEDDERSMRWIYHSNVRTTALVLQALLTAEGEVPFGEKIVKWLNTERKAGRWRNTQENIYVFDAFTTYYRTYEKVKPDFTAQVLLDAKEVMEEIFKGRSLDTRKTTLSLKDLPKEKRMNIQIGKEGEGRLYYGVRLTYAKKGFYEGVDRGISVTKKVVPLEGGFIGFKRGALYRITLTLLTSQERLFVVLDDPIPAGFEIVNTGFQTVATEQKERLSEIRRRERTRWWGSFDHEEIYDDRYLIFATSLDEGEHKITYLAKALTPGRFLMPPTKAEEMYAPEVFGTTSQGEVRIR